VLGTLEEIYRRFGLHRSAQQNLTLPGASGAVEIRQIMQRLRASPPTALGAERVLTVRDLSRGVRTGPAGEEPLELPHSDVLTFELESGGRVTARPSGTEPKIKFYFEVCEAISPREPLAAAKARADARIGHLIETFLEVVKRPPAPT
jgi:phosphomannomutase